MDKLVMANGPYYVKVKEKSVVSISTAILKVMVSQVIENIRMIWSQIQLETFVISLRPRQ